MSGIYGLFRWDGAPVLPEQLAGMASAMAYYGPEGQGRWFDGSIGLGQLLLRTTPEDAFEVQPLVSQDAVLVSTGQLDYREELWRDLDIHPSTRSALPDSALILRAYQRWGEACVDHLLGDWSFALWDTIRRKLFLARDAHGNTVLYYHRDAHRFAFASSLKGLLALSDTPRRPNLLEVARVLVAWPGDGIATAYEGIETLPPAHTLKVSREGAERRRYWFPEALPTLDLPRDQDYLDQFLEIYSQAVRARLRSVKPVGAALSGGLDSGSVVALTAPMLREQGRELVAFTAIPKYDHSSQLPQHRSGNEWDLAQATARMAGVTQHLPERAEGVSLSESIQRCLDVHDLPGYAVGNYHWILAMLEGFRAKGVGVVLTGHQGNGSVSCAGGRDWWFCLLDGQVRRAWEELQKAEPSLWRALRHELTSVFLQPLRRFYRYHVRGRGAPWTDYSSIHPDLARRLDIGSRMGGDGHDPTFTIQRRPRNLAILRPGRQTAGATWHDLGSAFGLAVRDPTADQRVIEFCLRCPDTQYRRHGQNRMLIRRAMAGRLPPEVLQSQRRGLQAADLALRALEERPQLQMTLEQLSRHALVAQCLDLPRMGRILSTLCPENAAASQIACAAILLRGTRAGLFLQRF